MNSNTFFQLMSIFVNLFNNLSHQGQLEPINDLFWLLRRQYEQHWDYERPFEGADTYGAIHGFEGCGFFVDGEFHLLSEEEEELFMRYCEFSWDKAVDKVKASEEPDPNAIPF